MRFKLSIGCILLFFSLPGCADRLTEVEQTIIAKDPRNENVLFRLTKNDSDLIFSLDKLKQQGSAMDVFRVVAQSAVALGNNTYDEVVFAFRDKPKFKVKGDSYQKLGSEFGNEPPAYIIRTWTEKLLTMDGEPAFKKHTGGLLYVVTESMKDFSEWHQEWYVDDLLREKKAEVERKMPKQYADDEAF